MRRTAILDYCIPCVLVCSGAFKDFASTKLLRPLSPTDTLLRLQGNALHSSKRLPIVEWVEKEKKLLPGTVISITTATTR